MRAQMHNFSFWTKCVNPDELKRDYKSKLNVAGFSILNLCEYHFKPHGYTLLFLLGESHLAIHTFPEEQQTYVELTSCVKDPFVRFIHNL